MRNVGPQTDFIMKFNAIIKRRGNNFLAVCPDLAGCEGAGPTKEEALEVLRDNVMKALGWKQQFDSQKLRWQIFEVRSANKPPSAGDVPMS
jgi:hypothetical protein